MWPEIRAWRALLQDSIRFVRIKRTLGIADKFDAANQIEPIDHDLDLIAFVHLANRAAGQRLRGYVPHAGACRYSAESGIRQNSDVLAMWKGLQRGCDLIDFLHTRTLWAGADENDHIAVPDLSILDRVDRIVFVDKYSCWSAVPVDLIFIHKRRIDGSALDDGALRRKISDGEADG